MGCVIHLLRFSFGKCYSPFRFRASDVHLTFKGLRFWIEDVGCVTPLLGLKAWGCVTHLLGRRVWDVIRP